MTIYHSLKIAIARTYSERNWKCSSSSLSISQKNFLCWLAKMYKTLSIESQFFMALSYFYKHSFSVFSRANRWWLTNDLVGKLMTDPWKKMAKPWGQEVPWKNKMEILGTLCDLANGQIQLLSFILGIILLHWKCFLQFCYLIAIYIIILKP